MKSKNVVLRMKDSLEKKDFAGKFLLIFIFDLVLTLNGLKNVHIITWKAWRGKKIT